MQTEKEATNSENIIINTNSAKNNKDNNNLKGKEIWSKLRKIIFSKDRYEFLNKVDHNLNLFNKTQEKEIITYKSINPFLEKAYSIKLRNQISVKKPFTEIKKEEIYNYIKESIDNTGNIQLWPGEEILSIYCLINMKNFNNKRIIELGAGFSGLASLIIAQKAENVVLEITDGNTQCSNNIKTFSIENNKHSFNEGNTVNASTFVWDRNKIITDKYDYVIIADCLFFEKYHIDLVINIKNLLNDSGKCIIMSPPRGKTMDNFLNICIENNLIIECKENFTSKEYFNIVKQSNKDTSDDNNDKNHGEVDSSADYNCYLIILSLSTIL